MEAGAPHHAPHFHDGVDEDGPADVPGRQDQASRQGRPSGDVRGPPPAEAAVPEQGRGAPRREPDPRRPLRDANEHRRFGGASQSAILTPLKSYFRFLRRSSPVTPVAGACAVDFELSDDRKAVVALLNRMAPLEGGAESPSVLDLRRVEYLGPFAATLLLASHRQAVVDGRPFRIFLPQVGSKARAFSGFAGLEHLLGQGGPPRTNHPENVTVPLTAVNVATWGVADPVIELVRRFVVISEDDETYLTNCITEVIQNVEDHAESAVGAISCARYLCNKNIIRVSIVDRGLGIGTTLAKLYPDLSSAESALKRVIRGGVSAKSRRNNMGVGISNLWSQVTNPLKGDIFIVSEDAIAYTERGSTWVGPLGARFAGTGVFFSVPVADKGNVP